MPSIFPRFQLVSRTIRTVRIRWVRFLYPLRTVFSNVISGTNITSNAFYFPCGERKCRPSQSVFSIYFGSITFEKLKFYIILTKTPIFNEIFHFNPFWPNLSEPYKIKKILHQNIWKKLKKKFFYQYLGIFRLKNKF